MEGKGRHEIKQELSKGPDDGAAVFNSVGIWRRMLCHGISAISGTHAPDLRRSTIPQSVRDGALVANDMPQFAQLTDMQRDDLREYIRTEAHKVRSRQTTG